MRSHRTAAPLAALVALSAITAPTALGTPVHPAYDLTFAKGPTSPEDLVPVPGTGTVIASGLAEDPLADGAVGHLYAIDSGNRAVTEIWPDRPSEVAWDRELYEGCPGPPEQSVASPHGVNVEQLPDGTTDLYVVNHGGREAIEVFNLDSRGGLSLSWVGCVPMPRGTFANAVAPIPHDDGFVATNFFDPTVSDPFSQVFSGKPSGDLMRWSPGDGWSVVPGSELAGPNGVVLSRSGRTAYVAEWGARRVHRIPLGPIAGRSALGRTSVEVPFLPDNLRWSTRGDLLVTGQDYTLDDVLACQEDDLANCPTGLSVVAVGPLTMGASTLFGSSTTDFRAPTVAAQVGEEVWVGSVKGDEIGILRPHPVRAPRGAEALAPATRPGPGTPP